MNSGTYARPSLGARPKDARDTFASELISNAIPLAYIGCQLGHADLSTTSRHYARWVNDDDSYRAPAPLEPGEVPTDLLAREEAQPLWQKFKER